MTEAVTHPLMWAHYGAGHNGICFEFFCEAESPFWSKALKVRYTEDFPTVNPIRQNNQEISALSVTTKGSDWKYEEEWRLINFVSGAGSWPYPPGALKAVILGARAEGAMERVRTLIAEANHDIQLKRAVAQPGQFAFRMEVVE